MQYVVAYEQTPENWSAYVPDLPGCIAAADTRADVERLIREAIQLYIEALQKDSQPVPRPGAWTGLGEV